MLEEILQNGEYQLTTKEIREIKDQCFGNLVAYIVKNFSDAKGNPYSYTSVQDVLKQCKVNVDVKQSAQSNFNSAKKKIQGKIILKPRPGDLEVKQMVSWSQYHKVKSDVKPLRVKITNEKMLDDGYELTMQVPADSMDRLTAMLQALEL